MSKSKYLLIDASILPEIYGKVLEAKSLILSGEASSVSQAVKMTGISRSAYYKYKDKIIEYNESAGSTFTIGAKLLDNAGVLSTVLNEIYLVGANVLSINQSSPVNGLANVSITVSLTDSATTTQQVITKIKKIGGVKTADIV